jgi:hypothetical protein
MVGDGRRTDDNEEASQGRPEERRLAASALQIRRFTEESAMLHKLFSGLPALLTVAGLLAFAGPSWANPQTNNSATTVASDGFDRMEIKGPFSTREEAEVYASVQRRIVADATVFSSGGKWWVLVRSHL